MLDDETRFFFVGGPPKSGAKGAYFDPLRTSAPARKVRFPPGWLTFSWSTRRR